MNTKYLIEEQTLTDIADSIREMEGSDDTILVEEYANRIKDIQLMPYEYLAIDLLCQDITNYISEVDRMIDPADVDVLTTYIELYNTLGGGYNA